MYSDFYNHHAAQLAPQYLSASFDSAHGVWADRYLLDVLNNPRARVLDVGAGAGRDVAHMAKLAAETHGNENEVYICAVEPAEKLAAIGRKHTKGLGVEWMHDRLPGLAALTRKEISFDLILLSAVWMHLPESDRARALRKLANLLKPGGKLVISLRRGSTPEECRERRFHPVDPEALKRSAQDIGLFPLFESQSEPDGLHRNHVSWTTVVFQLPDDGSGAFPFIRHVTLNDGKSATHKLALLRVLLRIADGYPGAVLRREAHESGDRVILPAGLVALYWCHQYKRLIDQFGLFQTPAKENKMGFIKPKGWGRLTHRSPSDYTIGHYFEGEDAQALHHALSAAIRNIRDMPCNYITQPNSQAPVFHVDVKRVNAKSHLFLDVDTLAQWGEFSLPEHIWLTLNRFACWIEPVIISEWARTMARYQGNAAFQAPATHHHLYAALEWLEVKRSTEEVRKRVEKMTQAHPISCIWSARRLGTDFDIDHCMPFARWPNNDLWNLLPAAPEINRQKRDHLPTRKKMENARSRIQDFWAKAWLTSDSPFNQQRFFAQANLALPGLTPSNRSIDDLFDALVIQRSRLKEMQQLKDW